MIFSKPISQLPLCYRPCGILWNCPKVYPGICITRKRVYFEERKNPEEMWIAKICDARLLFFTFLFYAHPGVSWEAVYLWGTVVSVVRNLSLTTDRSALILTQTLIKDASNRCFLWLTQPPTSKRVQPPSFSCRCWPCFVFFFFKYTLQETKDLETASIVSSTVDSSRGKLALEQNGPSLNLSNQQTQVEVKTWRCVLSVIV